MTLHMSKAPLKLPFRLFSAGAEPFHHMVSIRQRIKLKLVNFTERPRKGPFYEHFA